MNDSLLMSALATSVKMIMHIRDSEECTLAQTEPKKQCSFIITIKTKLKPLCKTKTKLKLKSGHSKLTQLQQTLKLLSEGCNTCCLPHEQETSVRNALLVILYNYWYNPLTVPNWFGMTLNMANCTNMQTETEG